MDLFKVPSKLEVISDKLSPKTHPRRSINYQSIETRLGIKTITKEEKFDSTFKDFKDVETFVPLNALLQELNQNNMDPAQKELHEYKQKQLQEMTRIQQWKSEYPSNLEQEHRLQFKIRSDLVKQARSMIDVHQPELQSLVKDLKPYIKDRFTKIDLKNTPQLQLFKDILDTKTLPKLEQVSPKKKKLGTFLSRVEKTIVNKGADIEIEEYYTKFNEDADQLRIRLRKQQMDFFHQKWGNSVVKMKSKQLEFKKQKVDLRKSRKTMKPIIVDPQIKDIIEEICEEEADMIDQKKYFRQQFRDLDHIQQESLDKYSDRNITSIRITLRK